MERGRELLSLIQDFKWLPHATHALELGRQYHGEANAANAPGKDL